MTPQEIEALYDACYLGLNGKFDALKYNFKARTPANICNGVFYKLSAEDYYIRLDLIRLFTLTVLCHGAYKRVLGAEETLHWKEYLQRLRYPNLYFSKEIKDLSIENLKRIVNEDEFGSELARKVLSGEVHPITFLQIDSITGCGSKWKWKGWTLHADKFCKATKFMQFSREEQAKIALLFHK